MNETSESLTNVCVIGKICSPMMQTALKLGDADSANNIPIKSSYALGLI
jgi:hypothetical protein